MRVFILTLIVGLTCAAPQGYNYQIELGSLGNSVQAIPNQYQILQQQQPPEIVYQEQAPQLQNLAQTVTVNQQGGFQFGDQLLQNAQEVIQYEQQQQHLKVPHAQEVIQYEQQHQEQEPKITQQAAPVVKQPPTEIVDIIEPPKPVKKQEIVIATQPKFIIQTKVPKHPDTFNDAPVPEKKVTFQKEFYYLSAPKEEEDETPKDLEDQLSTLKKNLRVVFIKAPENNGIENAALKLAQQSVNSQTAIYVLTKQHSASELAQKLQTIQASNPQSPEVAFIKYRTPEEAEHAQRVIQAQYEALDGPNHINRPDTGATHNFVGASAGGVDPRKPSSLVAGEEIEISKPVSKYLPAAVKH